MAIAQTERRDLDSIILENGQSPFSVLPPDVVAVRRKLVSEQGQGVFIPPPPPTSFGIPGNHPSADWVKRRLTPHPVNTFDSPSKSPTQSWIGGASSSAITTGRCSPASTSRRSRDGGRRPGRPCSWPIWRAVALTLRQPYRCMVPTHGSSLKPPPDTTPDDAGDPSRVVFCLYGPSE